MDYINHSRFKKAQFLNETFQLRIHPFEYLDHRNPRLPRKSSRGYNLGSDVQYYFNHVFSEIKTEPLSSKFKVRIIVRHGNDGLGGADLDNYCKAILDGVTATQKVWWDDKQVDELKVKRVYSSNKASSILVKIQVLN